MKAGHLFSLFSTVQLKEETAGNNISYRIRIGGSFDQAVMSLLPTTDNTVTDDDDANDLMNSPFEPLGTCCDTQDLNAELRDLQMPWRTIKIKILTHERSYESCIVDSQRQTLGGVIRQFYTQLLKVIADTVFQGDTY